jgi:hypothetical protein
MSLVVASAAALGSALSAAAGGVLQHRAARQAPTGTGLHIRLLTNLATRRAWIIGQAVALPAFALHVLALSAGQLGVVQPLLVCGLLFALPASVMLDHRRPNVVEWFWALTLVAALSTFLIVASPSSGHVPSDTDRLAFITLTGFAVAAATVAYTRVLPRHRALLLGAAGGLAYGLSAALLKEAITLGSGPDPTRLLTSWAPYLLAAVGVGALVVTQAAYQSGPLAASLPPLTILNPVAAVTVGVLAFHEHLAHSPAAIAGQTACLALMSVAVIQLAQRSNLANLTHHKPQPLRADLKQ